MYMHQTHDLRPPYVQFYNYTKSQMEKDSLVIPGERNNRIKIFHITVVNGI